MQRTMDIEDLLGWTYRAQLADVVIERGYGLHPIERQADGIPVFRASADGVVACMKSGALGTSAIGGAASVKADLHPDAERVHKTVMMLGGVDAMLIIRHAKAATTPDWLPDARHRFEPVWKLRLFVLERDFYVCQDPGCGQAATEVDHIVPRRKGGTDSLDNLQSLCKPHHSAKTQREDAR